MYYGVLLCDLLLPRHLHRPPFVRTVRVLVRYNRHYRMWWESLEWVATIIYQLSTSLSTHPPTCSLIHRVTHSLTSPPTCPLTHHPLTHLLSYSTTCSLTHSLTCSVTTTCPLTHHPLTHMLGHYHLPTHPSPMLTHMLGHYHLLTHPLTHMLGHYHLLTHSLTHHPPTHSPAHSLTTHSLTHSLTHLLRHSTTHHPLTNLLTLQAIETTYRNVSGKQESFQLHFQESSRLDSESLNTLHSQCIIGTTCSLCTNCTYVDLCSIVQLRLIGMYWYCCALLLLSDWYMVDWLLLYLWFVIGGRPIIIEGNIVNKTVPVIIVLLVQWASDKDIPNKRHNRNRLHPKDTFVVTNACLQYIYDL